MLGFTTDELLIGKTDEVRLIPSDKRKSFDELILRIRVDTCDGDKIRVNLPMTLVKVSLGTGVDIVNVDAMKNVDWNQIVSIAENGTIMGKIVEVETCDGDYIEMVIE